MKHTEEALPTFDGFDLLLKKRDGPCLTMLLPFREGAKKQNIDLLHRSLRTVSLQLQCYPCDPDRKDKITRELQMFALSFDPIKCDQSVGLFIANDITRLIFFPFAVEESVQVMDSFQIDDVLQKQRAHESH